MCARPHIILVRQWDTQMTGSGCCGKLGGAGSMVGDADAFSAARADMEAMGAVYRALRDAFGEAVTITVADPRNLVWLLPTLIRDGWRASGPAGAWRALRHGFAPGAIIADGHVLFSHRIPTPGEAREAVGRILEGARTSVPTAERTP